MSQEKPTAKLKLSNFWKRSMSQINLDLIDLTSDTSDDELGIPDFQSYHTGAEAESTFTDPPPTPRCDLQNLPSSPSISDNDSQTLEAGNCTGEIRMTEKVRYSNISTSSLYLL